jgi:hypothetical protein
MATRQVKVTAKDVEAVSKKLNAFAKELPEGEQNVLAWLLSRAAAAPVQKEAKAALVPRGTAATATTKPSASTAQLSRALGIPQFAGARRPGSLAAGSSIGVTATVMF